MRARGITTVVLGGETRSEVCAVLRGEKQLGSGPTLILSSQESIVDPQIIAALRPPPRFRRQICGCCTFGW
jgi:hypothetical protein